MIKLVLLVVTIVSAGLVASAKCEIDVNGSSNPVDPRGFPSTAAAAQINYSCDSKVNSRGDVSVEINSPMGVLASKSGRKEVTLQYRFDYKGVDDTITCTCTAESDEI